ncbi:MAG: extracellular solute-binding protein [Oscillospiraceae bacterium]|nr:extracellular solute-binding protein [Oscillospiraceae bacterium]
MKMNFLKLTALAAAMVLGAAACSGCGRMKEDGATLELNMDNSWRSEKTLTGVSHSAMFSVGKNMLCHKEKTNGEQEFVRYELETGHYERFFSKTSETLEGVDRIQCVPIRLPDGNVGIINMVYRGVGGGEVEVRRRTMDVYDTQLQFLETREIPTDFFGGSYYYFNTTAIDSKGNWYLAGWDERTAPMTVYNSGFEEYGEIEVPYDRADRLFTGADGAVYAAASTWNERTMTEVHKIYKLDAEARTCEDIGVYMPNGGYWYAAGTQGYTFYYSDHEGIYGVKDNERTLVVSYLNSDFSTNSIRQFYPMENGDFVLFEEKNKNYWYATPRSQEEIDNTKLISLAAVDLSSDLEKAVIDYNRAESGYRIVVMDYSEYNTRENPYQGYETMKKDMLDGIVADIICTDGVNFESLATKGLFADWYTLMDADEEFDRSDYITNFFETHEYNGKLLRLGVSYRIHSTAAKTKFVGETQGLSLGEQLDVPVPDGMDRLVEDPADYMAERYMANMQTGCINRKTAQCCFDSPEFVKLLEMLNAIPTSETYYEKDPQVWESNNPWKDEQIMFHEFEIAQPIDLHSVYRAVFYDEDATLTGYPMVWDEGNGGMFETSFTVSVNAQSAEKAAIWDFMKHLLSEDYQRKLTEYMPVHEGALDYKLEEAEHMTPAATWGVQIGEMKEWETDILRDYIHGIRTCYYFDTKVYTVLLEEAEKMLAGDQTPEETAKMMQSRVSLYLSEQS